jgi:hypothetical protein
MLCVRLFVSLALLINLARGQVDSPSFPSDAPIAHPLNNTNTSSSLEAALTGLKTGSADLINLDEFNVAEVEDAVESASFSYLSDQKNQSSDCFFL